MPNFSIPQSAFNALDMVVQAAANNIANVNTNGYKAQRVVLQSGPQLDEGVVVGAVTRDMSPGPAVVNHLAENDARVANDVSARSMRNTQENYDTSVAQDVDRLQQANAADAQHVGEYREGQRARTLIEGSNVDLPREFANLAVTETAYSAVATTIRTWDEMTGSILNVKI